MDRVTDASEGGIDAATVPGVGALLRAHIPKHGALKQKCLWAAESLDGVPPLNRSAGYLPDSTLGIGTVPSAGPKPRTFSGMSPFSNMSGIPHSLVTIVSCPSCH